MEIREEERAFIDIEGLDIEYHDEGAEKRAEDNSVRMKTEGHMREEQRLLKELEEFRSLPPSSERCIFRVPEKLQQSYKEAYTPRVIAIGPYHHGNQSLNPMESHKRLYLGSFLRHSGKHYHDYIEWIESSMARIKRCYDDKAYFGRDAAKMMLLDGSFMIQLFLIYRNRTFRPDGDRIFKRPWMLNNVRRDMMLLENQMPFFVVQGLFEMAYGSREPGLLELMYRFFKVMMIEVPEMVTVMERVMAVVMESEVKHVLDAIRFSYFRMWPGEMSKEIRFIPNATDLVGAGVKLRKGKSKCLFDIKFENGVLEIPPLNLYRYMDYFRNIIAFEQCYHEEDSFLTDYLVLIDQLVHVPADAKLLIDEGIIENWLGGEDAAADLINRYCKDIFLRTRGTHFDKLREDLVEHFKSRYNTWKVTFKRDYCSSPWKVLSVIAAVVLLALTVIQTVCSLLSME